MITETADFTGDATAAVTPKPGVVQGVFCELDIEAFTFQADAIKSIG